MVGKLRSIARGFVVAALLSVAFVHAQEATELAKHPDNVLKFEVKFDGPDAGKVKTVSLYFSVASGSVPADQLGFRTAFATNQFPPIAAKTFNPEVTIPQDVATGDYILYINVTADAGSAQYKGGDQFPMHVIHIENPLSFKRPDIKVKELS